MRSPIGDPAATAEAWLEPGAPGPTAPIAGRVIAGPGRPAERARSGRPALLAAINDAAGK